jgi:hypothetical protein
MALGSEMALPLWAAAAIVVVSPGADKPGLQGRRVEADVLSGARLRRGSPRGGRARRANEPVASPVGDESATEHCVRRQRQGLELAVGSGRQGRVLAIVGVGGWSGSPATAGQRRNRTVAGGLLPSLPRSLVR